MENNGAAAKPRTFTSVSIPNDLFDEYERQAKRIGIKASQLVKAVLLKNRKAIKKIQSFNLVVR